MWCFIGVFCNPVSPPPGHSTLDSPPKGLNPWLLYIDLNIPSSYAPVNKNHEIFNLSAFLKAHVFSCLIKPIYPIKIQTYNKWVKDFIHFLSSGFWDSQYI